MLHDPKWNHGTLNGLITWLEGRDRKTPYQFSACSDCLIARYMDGVNRQEWPQEMQEIYGGRDAGRIAVGPHGCPSVQTYGEALERAYASRAALVA